MAKRAIPDFPGYEVDEDGKAWKGDHEVKNNVPSGRTYITISLKRNGRWFNLPLHVVMLYAFVGPRRLGYEAAHKNDDRFDNRLANLEWRAMEYHELDTLFLKKRKGRQKGPRKSKRYVPTEHSLNSNIQRGSNRPASKLTEADIPTIRRRISAGDTQRIIAADYGVSQNVISDIANRKAWTHVPD